MSELGGSREIPSDAELLRRRQVWDDEVARSSPTDAPIIDEGPLDDPYHTTYGSSQIETSDSPPAVHSMIPPRLPGITLSSPTRAGGKFNANELAQIGNLLDNDLPCVQGTSGEKDFLGALEAENLTQLAQCIGKATRSMSDAFAATPVRQQAALALRTGRVIDVFAFAWHDSAAVHATAQLWLEAAITRADMQGDTKLATVARAELRTARISLQQTLFHQGSTQKNGASLG